MATIITSARRCLCTCPGLRRVSRNSALLMRFVATIVGFREAALSRVFPPQDVALAGIGPAFGNRNVDMSQIGPARPCAEPDKARHENTFVRTLRTLTLYSSTNAWLLFFGTLRDRHDVWICLRTYCEGRPFESCRKTLFSLICCHGLHLKYALRGSLIEYAYGARR